MYKQQMPDDFRAWLKVAARMPVTFIFNMSDGFLLPVLRFEQG